MQRDIEMFIDNIRKYEDIQTFNEADTRNVIINKLLSILGWNIYDKNEVSQEYDIRGKRADYSLKIEKNDKVFIEAKRVRESLNEGHEGQLLGYSLTKDIGLAVLTNGINWRFYLPLEGGSRKKRRFYEADILQQDPKIIASKFMDLLSKNNVSIGVAIDNAITIYRDRIKTIEATKNIIQPAKVQDTHTKGSLLVEYSSLADYNPVEKTILSFYFMNSKYPVEKWNGLLMGIIDIMHYMHREEFSKILNVTGRSRIYFSYNSNDLSTPKKIKDTNIYVETKLGAKGILKLCIDILYEFGYPITYFAIETLEDKIIGNIASTQPAKVAKIEHISAPVAIIDESDVKGRKKGEIYGKYKTATVSIIPWVKKQIMDSIDGIVRVKVKDMAKEMGSEFEKKSNTSIYWGLKYVLFKEDIVVDMSTHTDRDKLLVMRTRTSDDELPPSLAKHLEDKEFDPGDESDYIIERYNIEDDTQTIKQEDIVSKEKLKIDTLYTESDNLFCSNCGEGISTDEKFCKYCGYNLGQKLNDKKSLQRDLEQRQREFEQKQRDLEQKQREFEQKQRNIAKEQTERDRYIQDLKEKRKRRGTWINIKGALCYSLGFITGIFFLLLEKDNEFVRFHAIQSTITFLSLFIITILWRTESITTLIWILQLFIWLLLMSKSLKGEMYKLPIIGNVADSLETYVLYK